LDANEWDIKAAVTEFFAEQDEALQEMNVAGGRQLTDNPAAPTSATSAQPSHSRKPPEKKFATLGDLGGGNAGPDSADDEGHQDFFAGGEKSGLAVQNPDNIKQKILEKAR
jgi:UBX domain-containing protein 1